MTFWDDTLRICPKCKTAVRVAEEPHATCPKCRTQVWFFNYRPLPRPPELPRDSTESLWKDSLTQLLLASIVILALIALLGVFLRLVVPAVCALISIGFGIFAFMRHQEAHGAESRLTHADEMSRYAAAMRERVKECVLRYNALLATGDRRIEHYLDEIYRQAQQVLAQAAEDRQRAEEDRRAVAHVDQRIYAMAERLIRDHLKWSSQKLRPDPENYQRRKLELESMFDFVEQIGYPLPKNLRAQALSDLKASYAEVVRVNVLKEQQRQLQQQMREEERRRREAERVVEEEESRERELQRRLDAALREHRGVTDAEIESLRQQLEEARARAERAKSMAELTKVGHVYILSNLVPLP